MDSAARHHDGAVPLRQLEAFLTDEGREARGELPLPDRRSWGELHDLDDQSAVPNRIVGPAKALKRAGCAGQRYDVDRGLQSPAGYM